MSNQFHQKSQKNEISRVIRQNSPSCKNRDYYLNKSNCYTTVSPSVTSVTTSTSSSPSLYRKQSETLHNNSSISTECDYKKFSRNLHYPIENRRRDYKSPTNIHHQSSKIHDFIHLSLPTSEATYTSDELYSSTSSPVSPLSATVNTTTQTNRPALSNILRAVSFDSRFTREFDDTNDIHSCYISREDLFRQTESRSRLRYFIANNNNNNNNNNDIMNTNQSLTPVIKHNQLTVTPSIEISLVIDEQTNSDNNNDDICDNEKEKNKSSSSEPSSFYKKSRDRQNPQRSSIHSSRSSALRIDSDNPIDDNTSDKNVCYQQQRQQQQHLHDDNYTDHIRNRTLSSHYLSTQNEFNINVESNIPSSSNSNNNNKRGKLIRQSHSFQNPTDHLTLSNSDNANCLSSTMYNQKKFHNQNDIMDEFDYFCHIANVPRDQEKINSTFKSLHSTLSTSNIRSNSMRESSLERQKDNITNYSISSRSEQNNCHIKNTKFNKINYLKPPAKGQLRRASTEEDSLNKSLSLYKRPITATLSYASMTNSYTNLCTTPPKSIPSVPDIMDEIHNPTSPLGVPLSLDSMSADEPGLTFYQVQVLGVSGVGKTLLCHQLAALVRGNSPSCDPDELDNKLEIYTITTTLCGSVYTVNFVDTSAENFENNLEVQIRDCIDAFIVVYAIDDQNSFEAAKLIINALIPLSDTRHRSMLSSKSMSNSMTTLPGLIYLVGNKSDLVRGRQVSIDEGRHLASMHGAKFIEVSASLNHMVADLFILLIGHLHESEQRGRDPRLPADRRTNPLQSNLLTSSSKSITNSNIVNTFKIPTATKASFSRFLKKHFIRSSQESD
ncbi:hypothetical protein MN116_000957 [Schistosoma mekongi]|uniref:Uncharacterized protein n=1 Tax=Schistosoma mekongi TaxID=38744 RepID=A0AAE2D9Z3_SCHME|nr:hypothetical protein MN116_000957 [Schistosoma mekongi]